MNYLASFIIPILERELLKLEPEVAQFLLQQFKLMATELVDWAEVKLNTDLNGDGKIGGDK